jgi:iron(III) transport system permease protein
MFVNAVTTISAVIFLYGSGTKLASTEVVHMDEAGAIASAASMATIIMLAAIVAKALHLALDRLACARLQRWRRR